MSRCAVEPGRKRDARRFVRSGRVASGGSYAVRLWHGLGGRPARRRPGAGGHGSRSACRPIEPEAGYEQAVQALALRDIANVAGDPSFAPTDVVTRAQMAVYLARALRLPDDRYSAFVDVERGGLGVRRDRSPVQSGGHDGHYAARPSRPNGLSPARKRRPCWSPLSATRRRSKGPIVGDSLTPYRIKDWLAGFKDRGLIGPAVRHRRRHRLPGGAVRRPVRRLAASLRSVSPSRNWSPCSSGPSSSRVATRATRALSLRRSTLSDAYPKLSKGSSGPLVLLLEPRLTALHYPCGAVDGKYDYQHPGRGPGLPEVRAAQADRRGGSTRSGQRLLVAQAPAPVYMEDAGGGWRWTSPGRC